MKKLFEFSINNPLFVNLFTIFIVIGGLLSMYRLNREVFPNVELDIVLITAVYPGAAPPEIEKLITIPIERELKEVSDIQKMTSASVEGRSVIVLELDEDLKDKASVVDDIRRAVDQANDLPTDLEDDPEVLELRMRDQPVVQISLSGEFERAELQRYAKALETELLDLPGVASVVRDNWLDPEVWVEVDPQRAADYQLSLVQIVSALRAHNVSVSGGSLIVAGTESLIRTSGEFSGADEIRNAIIRSSDRGDAVKVSDVASVSEAFERESVIMRTNGSTAVNLVVVKKEHSDAIDVVDAIRSVVARYEQQAPQGLAISFHNDLSYYVKRRLDVLVGNGIMGVILVVGTLFFFLSFRASILTAIGIPTSFLATFLIMDITSVTTMNMLAMFGLIMVSGMLVDDAIVIVDNAYRHLKAGLSPVDAALNGVNEVWKPVLTSILTTIAAYGSLMFMSGMIGKFMWHIPIVVIIALSASVIEAFVVLPSHLAEVERIHHLSAGKQRRFARARVWCETNIERMIELYVHLLQKVLRRRYLFSSLAISVAIISITVAVVAIPFILFPHRGMEAFVLKASMPMGTPVEETARAMRAVEELIAQLPKDELDTYVMTAGLQQQEPNDPETRRGSHLGQVFVYLTPLANRERDAEEIIEELRPKLSAFTGFTEIGFEKINPGPPVGKPIEVQVKGEDLPELIALSDQVKNFLGTVSGVSDIRDSHEEGKEELRVVVDQARAQRAMLSIEDVALGIRMGLDGAVGTTIKKTEEEIDIRVKFPEALRYDRAAWEKIHIPNGHGDLIPLEQVARVERSPGILAINHHDRKRVITVTANVDGEQETTVSVTKKLQGEFQKSAALKPGSSLSFGGEWEKSMKSLHDFFFALALTVMVIFLILVFEFRSLLDPLIVLCVVPFGFVGAVAALLLHGEPKSILSLLGAVGLAGVIVNNAIVYIDFIKSAQASGVDRFEAVVQAGRHRMRPIILTSVTTVFGVLPIAYGLGGFDPFLRPMALTLGWGLLFGTSAALFVTPAFYLILDDLRQQLRRRWARVVE